MSRTSFGLFWLLFSGAVSMPEALDNIASCMEEEDGFQGQEMLQRTFAAKTATKLETEYVSRVSATVTKEEEEDAEAASQEAVTVYPNMQHTSQVSLVNIKYQADLSSGSGGQIWCKRMNKVCVKIFDEAAGELDMCFIDDADAGAGCEAVGLGPEDPSADACAAAFAGVVSDTCVKLTQDKAVKFGS